MKGRPITIREAIEIAFRVLREAEERLKIERLQEAQFLNNFYDDDNDDE